MADKGIYTVGGTVQAGPGIYIKRQADDELQDLCRRHQFAYLLAARQVGKSSLMIRTAEQLVDANVRSVIVDVTLLGTQATDEEWYLGFLSVINRQLNLKLNIAQFWQQQGPITANQRFANFIEEILIAKVEQPIVIFVDEIDTTLGLPFRDDFFATIRYLFNARATAPELGRLSFTLIGVASPSDLINDPKRTPFNIGYRVDLTDFTFAEASVLADGFGLPHRDAEDVLKRVLDWTGGHPYLTQRLCSAIVEKRAQPQSQQDVDRIVQSVFLGEMSERDNNLQFVRDMLTERAPDRGAVLAAYHRILISRRSVPDEQQSLIISHLKLSGIVCGDGAGGLRIRNRIYRKVFDRQWIRSHRPENWWRAIPSAVKVTAAAIVLLAVALLISLLFAVGQFRQAQELADARAAEVALRGTAEAVAQENRRLAEQRAEESREAQTTAEEALKQLEQQTRLMMARQLADDAVENLDNFDLSLLLSVEASRMAATRETKGSLLTVLDSNSHLIKYLHGHSAPLMTVALDPQGRILASAGHDRRIILWDAKTGLQLGDPIAGFADVVVSLAFSPDGNVLASGIGDGSIHLWDIAGRRQIGPDLNGHTSWVYGLTFSPNGQILASASADHTIVLWDTASGKRMGDPLVGHKDEVMGLAVSPDGKVLASSSRDARILLWDVATGKTIGEPLVGHDDTWVRSIVFSPDGKMLASAGYDGRIVLWDVESGRPLGEALAGHSGIVTTIAFSPDGRILASGGGDKSIILWDMDTRLPIGAPLKGHTGLVSDLVFYPDGQSLASVAEDGKVVLWDVQPRQRMYQRLREHVDDVTSVVFNRDGTMLASSSLDGDLILWNLKTRPTSVRRLSGHTDRVETVAFSPDGQMLASGGWDMSVILWDVVTGQPRCPALAGHTKWIESVAFSPDGLSVASGSADGTIRLWSTESCQPLGEPFTGHKDGVESVAFSPDGKLLASGSWDGSIILWNTTTGQPLGSPLTGHTNWVHSVAFSPNGEILASGSADGGVRLWQTMIGQVASTLLEGHKNEVNSVAFSPDGRTLVSGDRDNKIILWDLATGEPSASALDAHAGWVWSAAFHPNGRTVASGHADGSVVLWDVNLDSWQALARKRANRDLTAEEWQRFMGTDIPQRATCPTPDCSR